MQDRPADETRARIERLAGARATEWTRVYGGYGPTERWLVRLDDGTSVFAKLGPTETTARALRSEAPMLRHLADAPFAPRMIAFDDADPPLLILEDLSHAFWPPPWTRALVDRVLETLSAIASTPAPEWVGSAEEYRGALSGWVRIAADRVPFLGLGLVSESWLDHSLPDLLDAERRATLDGDALCHVDVRSDNMCFAGERTVVVDWNFACRGNALADVAAWLPSLAAEGGPQPDEILDGQGELAALVVGYFASKAGLPPDDFPRARRVRDIQRRQLVGGFPWLVRVLGLPAPDGPRASQVFSRA